MTMMLLENHLLLLTAKPDHHQLYLRSLTFFSSVKRHYKCSSKYNVFQGGRFRPGPCAMSDRGLKKSIKPTEKHITV